MQLASGALAKAPFKAASSYPDGRTLPRSLSLGDKVTIYRVSLISASRNERRAGGWARDDLRGTDAVMRFRHELR